MNIHTPLKPRYAPNLNKPQRTRYKWNADDISTLMELNAAGCTPEEIGKHLKRSDKAVTQKINKIKNGIKPFKRATTERVPPEVIGESIKKYAVKARSDVASVALEGLSFSDDEPLKDDTSQNSSRFSPLNISEQPDTEKKEWIRAKVIAAIEAYDSATCKELTRYTHESFKDVSGALHHLARNKKIWRAANGDPWKVWPHVDKPETWPHIDKPETMTGGIPLPSYSALGKVTTPKHTPSPLGPLIQDDVVTPVVTSHDVYIIRVPKKNISAAIYITSLAAVAAAGVTVGIFI